MMTDTALTLAVLLAAAIVAPLLLLGVVLTAPDLWPLLTIAPILDFVLLRAAWQEWQEHRGRQQTQGPGAGVQEVG
jgi:hypothetical protein